jgi:hypothetical protein
MNPKDKIIDGQVVRILNSTARVDAHDLLCINMVQENNV